MKQWLRHCVPKCVNKIVRGATKNTKAIAELIKAQNLADFAPEVWEKVLPDIRALLEKNAPPKSDDSDES